MSQSNTSTLLFHSPEAAPAAISHYSPAVETAGQIYCSGQLGIDPKTGQLITASAEERLETELTQLFKNLDALISGLGCTPEQVVKTTVFLSDPNISKRFNEYYARFFGEHRPARSSIGVQFLPLGALVEVELLLQRH